MINKYFQRRKEAKEAKNDVRQELQAKIEILEAQEEIGLGATNLEFYKRIAAVIGAF